MDDIETAVGMNFLYKRFLGNVKQYMAAQTKLRLEKASKFSDDPGKHRKVRS